jgi:hypothetical protein
MPRLTQRTSEFFPAWLIQLLRVQRVEPRAQIEVPKFGAQLEFVTRRLAAALIPRPAHVRVPSEVTLIPGAPALGARFWQCGAATTIAHRLAPEATRSHGYSVLSPTPIRFPSPHPNAKQPQFDLARTTASACMRPDFNRVKPGPSPTGKQSTWDDRHVGRRAGYSPSQTFQPARATMTTWIDRCHGFSSTAVQRRMTIVP